MLRLMLINKTHKVEFPDNNTGRMQIMAFRKSHTEFKRCRIKEIVQLLPSQVPCGEIVKWEYKR